MTMRAQPTISVVMSVHNGERFIVRAVMSILSQTFTDFELIVIDDGSTDNTAALVGGIKDPRILFVQQENIGLTKSLNKGVELASGKWIARHDADDFSISTRFQQQMRFLHEHPEIGLLGSNCLIQPERHWVINEVFCYPESYHEILAAFPSYNPFVHGSMIIDRKLLLSSGGYNPQYRYVQDYELWSRLIMKTPAHNLQAPLYVRSVHGGASQSRIDKESIFKEISGHFLEVNAGRYRPDPANLKPIRSIDNYPALTVKVPWNRSLRDSLARMSRECRRQRLPWLGLQVQSFLYYPWRWAA